MLIENIIAILLGIGLASAVGFRIFLPLFCISVAAKLGAWELAPSFEWMASTPSIIAFASATLVEIAAYFIPFIDNLLDTIAIPLAAVAGTIAMGSMLIEMEPLLKWILAIIAGGGTAGIIKGSSATTRAISTATTAGFGNPVIAGLEVGGSLLLTVMVLVKFVLAGILGIAILIFVFKFLFIRKTKD